MNSISVNFNNKNLFFVYRDILRSSGGIDKNIDLQTIQELFNENVYRIGTEHLSGQKIVIDLGSHIGTFAIMAAALGASKVYALEPNNGNLGQLLLNIFGNNFENVIMPVGEAIWSSSTTLEMDEFYSDSRVEKVSHLESGISKAITPPQDKEKFRVPTTTLENFLQENLIEEVDFLKCDVEWSEYEFIPTWSDEVMNKIKHIAIEFHGTDATTFGILVAHLTRCFRLEILGSFERGGFIWGRRY